MGTRSLQLGVPECGRRAAVLTRPSRTCVIEWSADGGWGHGDCDAVVQRPAGEEDAYGRLQPAQREGMYEVVAKQMKRELTVTRKRYVTDMERTLNDNVRLKAQVRPCCAT